MPFGLQVISLNGIARNPERRKLSAGQPTVTFEAVLVGGEEAAARFEIRLVGKKEELR